MGEECEPIGTGFVGPATTRLGEHGRGQDHRAVVKAAIDKIPKIGNVGATLKFGGIDAELLEKAIRPAGVGSGVGAARCP
jgi:hypothetical protein